jgi:tRNA pseudouridine38-40 synthase
MKKKTYKAIISYDGSCFYGWQSQLNHISVQTEIQNTIKKIWNYETVVEGASRTDSGVHSYGQTIKLLLPATIEINYLKKILNDNLPTSIKIRTLEYCEDDFSPRKDAKKKLYYYTIAFKKPSPLIKNFVTHYPYPLQKNILEKILKIFIGTHDFRSFATITKNDNHNINTIKTIYEIKINEINQDMIQIQIEGNGFLKYMVRRLVGAAITAAHKNHSVEYVQNILEKKNPSHHLITMPPEGLILVDIAYEERDLIYYSLSEILLNI